MGADARDSPRLAAVTRKLRLPRCLGESGRGHGDDAAKEAGTPCKRRRSRFDSDLLHGRFWSASAPGCGVRVSMSGLGPDRRGSSPCFPTGARRGGRASDDSLAQSEIEHPGEDRSGLVRSQRESPGSGPSQARSPWPASIVAMCQPSKLVSRVRSPGGPLCCSVSAPLAQLAEQRTLNPKVRGSIPWRRTRAWRNRQPRQAQTLVSGVAREVQVSSRPYLTGQILAGLMPGRLIGRTRDSGSRRCKFESCSGSW